MLKSKMNPRVFWGASLIIGALLAAALIAPGASDYAFGHAQDWVIATFGWFYVAAASRAPMIRLAPQNTRGFIFDLSMGPERSGPPPVPRPLALRNRHTHFHCDRSWRRFPKGADGRIIRL